MPEGLYLVKVIGPSMTIGLNYYELLTLQYPFASMDYITYAQKLDSMIYYIKSRSAADVSALSSRLGVSRRTVLRMVDGLRLKGHNIKYCKKIKAYKIE